jgi:dynein heavy chain
MYSICFIFIFILVLIFFVNAGPFNSDYRKLLVTDTWMPMIVKLQIPISPTFDFSLFLAEPTDVREWNLKGLPSDAFSVENGVLVTRGRRWPLMVDPQVVLVHRIVFDRMLSNDMIQIK